MQNPAKTAGFLFLGAAFWEGIGQWGLMGRVGGGTNSLQERLGRSAEYAKGGGGAAGVGGKE